MEQVQNRTRLDGPRHGDTSGIKAGKIAEHSTRHVDGFGATAHALVDNSTGGSLAVVGDSDLGTAKRLVHDGLRKSDNVLSGTVVGSVAVARRRQRGGSVVESTVTSAGMTRAAAARGASRSSRSSSGGGRAAAAGDGGGNGWCRRSNSGGRDRSSSGGGLRSRSRRCLGRRRRGVGNGSGSRSDSAGRNDDGSRGRSHGNLSGVDRGDSRSSLARIEGDGRVDGGDVDLGHGLVDDSALLVNRGGGSQGSEDRGNSESLGENHFEDVRERRLVFGSVVFEALVQEMKSR